MSERKDVHDLNLRDMTQEQIVEESLIELAYAILEDKKQAMQFNDLVKAIQAVNNMGDEEVKSRLLQFYTDLNIEGRFLLNQENGWGLREWYKVETIEEETAPTVKARKKKSKAVVDEDEELVDLDEEDIVFEEDFDEFIDVEDDEEVEDIDFVEADIEDLDEEIDEELIDGDEEVFVIDEEESDEDDLEEEEDHLK